MRKPKAVPGKKWINTDLSAKHLAKAARLAGVDPTGLEREQVVAAILRSPNLKNVVQRHVFVFEGDEPEESSFEVRFPDERSGGVTTMAYTPSDKLGYTTYKIEACLKIGWHRVHAETFNMHDFQHMLLGTPRIRWDLMDTATGQLLGMPKFSPFERTSKSPIRRGGAYQVVLLPAED